MTFTLTGLATSLACGAVTEKPTAVAEYAYGLMILKVVLSYALHKLPPRLLLQGRLQDRQGAAEGCPLSVRDDAVDTAGAWQPHGTTQISGHVSCQATAHSKCRTCPQ